MIIFYKGSVVERSTGKTLWRFNLKTATPYFWQKAKAEALVYTSRRHELNVNDLEVKEE